MRGRSGAKQEEEAAMTKTIDADLELAELEQERQRLALDVEEGQAGAAGKLERVESRISTLKRHVERQGLAQREREIRAASEEAERVAARQRELEAKLREALSRRGELAQAVEGAADQLVAAVAAL